MTICLHCRARIKKPFFFRTFTDGLFVKLVNGCTKRGWGSSLTEMEVQIHSRLVTGETVQRGDNIRVHFSDS